MKVCILAITRGNYSHRCEERRITELRNMVGQRIRGSQIVAVSSISIPFASLDLEGFKPFWAFCALLTCTRYQAQKFRSECDRFRNNLTKQNWKKKRKEKILKTQWNMVKSSWKTYSIEQLDHWNSSNAHDKCELS